RPLEPVVRHRRQLHGDRRRRGLGKIIFAKRVRRPCERSTLKLCPACGERSDCIADAIRVRGHRPILDWTSALCARLPFTPTLSPQSAGKGSAPQSCHAPFRLTAWPVPGTVRPLSARPTKSPMFSTATLWIPFTIVAALGQVARNAMQRSLTGPLGTWGATNIRFLFGFPFSIAFFG